jgi:hypothetical protein
MDFVLRNKQLSRMNNKPNTNMAHLFREPPMPSPLSPSHKSLNINL